MRTRVIQLVFLSVFLIGSTVSATAQVMSKQDYLDKSRRQRTAGFVMAGGGIVLAAVGFSMVLSEVVSLLAFQAPNDSKGSVGTAFVTVGTLSTLGSIPVFISSGKNARRAEKLTLRNEPVHLARYGGHRLRSVPSLRLEIPF